MFNAPGKGTGWGCLDLFLLYMVIGSAVAILAGWNMGGSAGGTLVGGVFWIVVSGFWFAWRRGWIQHYREQQKIQAEQAKLSERQREAERRQTQATATVTSQSSEGFNEDTQPSAAVIDASYSFPDSLQIHIPKDVPWSSTQALGFVRAVIEKFSKTVLQLSIVARPGRISWEVLRLDHITDQDRVAFENTVQTFYPGASVTIQAHATPFEKLYRRYHIFESQYLIYFQRALSVHAIRRDDPLASVVTAIGNLRDGEEMRYTIAVYPPYRHTEQEIYQMLTMSASEAGYRPGGFHLDTRSADHMAGSVLGSAVGWGLQKINLRNTRLDRFTPAETQTFVEKLGQPLLPVTLMMMLDTPDPARLSALDDALTAVMSLSGQEITIGKGYTSKTLELNNQVDRWTKHPLDYFEALMPEKQGDPDGTTAYTFTLTSEELAAWWHLPHKDMLSEEIVWAEAPLPSSVITTQISNRLVIGQAGGQTISLSYPDLRRHMFISGQTGTGKSNFLHNVAHQLLSTGQGFALLDPHKELVDDIIQSSVLLNRSDKVLLLDLNNTTHPIPLNPFRVPDDVSEKFAYNLALWIMKTVYKGSWSESQMETVVRRTLELVLTDPEATPLDMQRVLRNDNYRRKRFKEALERGMSTNAEMWWQDEYEPLSPSAKNEKTRSTLNRLRTFLDGTIELMTCHPRGLDFRYLIENGYVLLINLKGDEVESEVGSLGAILLAQIFMTCYSLGERIAGDAPPRYYLMIDETHTFITTTLDKMLSEARKYGLSLIMADQWLGQLDKDTQAAIRNNRGTTISFRASESEAPLTARLYEPQVTVQEIINQHVGQAAVRTLSNGETLPAFRVHTLPPLNPVSDPSTLVTWDSLWQQTIETLDLMPAQAVRSWIRERYRSKAKDASDGDMESSAPDETDIEILDDEG